MAARFRALFLVAVPVPIAGLALLAWWAAGQARDSDVRGAGSSLAGQATVLAELLAGAESAADPAELERAARLVQTLGVDAVVVGPDGVVRWTTSAAAQTAALSNDLWRHALRRDGVVRDVTRLGDGERVEIAATRFVRRNGEEGAVVLVAPTVDAKPSVIPPESIALAALTVAFVLAAAGVLGGISQRRRTRALSDRAAALAGGQSSGTAEVRGRDELAALGRALNSLGSRLRSQVLTIEEQSGLFAALVDRLRDGVIVTRSDGGVLLINPAAARLLNLRLGADGLRGFIGRPVEACITPLALQRLLLEPLPERLLRSRREDWGDELIGVEQRLTLDAASGTLHLLVRAMEIPLVDDAGEPGSPGRLLVLTDITDLQRTIQMRTDFVANASHELRTPLSTIRVATEALVGLSQAQDGEAARQFVDAIDRHSARLERMVEDLLDLSRIESTSAAFEPERLKINEVFEELSARFAESISRKNLRWDLSRQPPDSTQLVANGHLLRLVLDNLVENAIKFTPDGGSVSVRVERQARECRWSVSDTGCGIPEQEQSRVFERFYQVRRDRSGGERGTGLGLSIVRHAVQAMQGQVFLESVVGRGTTVTFTVPQPIA